jgi:hypothetical protein
MPANPDRAGIRKFLLDTLANGDVPAKEVEARARAAGWVAEGQILSHCKPLRRIADKLHILRYRREGAWFWSLPKPTQLIARKLPDASTKLPPPPPEDPAAARREFMKRTRAWFASEDFRLAVREANAEADAVIAKEYARRGLQR